MGHHSLESDRRPLITDCRRTEQSFLNQAKWFSERKPDFNTEVYDFLLETSRACRLKLSQQLCLFDRTLVSRTKQQKQTSPRGRVGFFPDLVAFLTSHDQSREVRRKDVTEEMNE